MGLVFLNSKSKLPYTASKIWLRGSIRMTAKTKACNNVCVTRLQTCFPEHHKAVTWWFQVYFYFTKICYLKTLKILGCILLESHLYESGAAVSLGIVGSIPTRTS